MEGSSVSRGVLAFDVDARHIQQLGRELVENKVTAVIELIKNAYDADASTVVVAGFGSVERGGEIHVVDDGVGMDLESVSNGWMRLSSDDKERNPLSTIYRRSRAGRKGIGRFSTQTLGSSLNLVSTRSGEGTSLSVDFYWDRDYVAGKDLRKIENEYRRVPGDPARHGTALRIVGISDPWSAFDWARVREAAMLLQPPFVGRRSSSKMARSKDFQPDPGFRVIVLGELAEPLKVLNPYELMEIGLAHFESSRDRKEIDRLEDELSGRFGHTNEARNLEDFLRSASATVRGSISSSGNLIWQITSDLFGIDEQGESVRTYGAVGEVAFEAAYFIYKREAIGDVKVRIAQEMGRQYGGVRIYRDGLRVMPYGDPGDDWLGLNQISSSRTFLPPFGVINFFGAVLIGRDANPLLVDTASREGIVEGPALLELRDAIVEVLRAAALAVAAARTRKAQAGRRNNAVEPPASRAALLDRAILELTSSLGASDVDGKAVERFSEIASQLKEDAEESDRLASEERDELVGEVSMLRVLASLGTASTVFSHEVSGALHRSRAAIDDALRAAGEGPGTSIERKHLLDRSLRAVEGFLTQLGELSNYIVAYTSSARRRDRSALPCHQILVEFGSAFSGLLDQRSIEMVVSVTPRSLRTSAMARSELEAILFNLLSNAVKALDRDSVTDRRLRIDARSSEDGRNVVIRFQDSGVGVPDRLRETIFEPFVTVGEVSSTELGTGTGLGLAVVRDIVDSYDGRAFVGSPSQSMVTCFEIHLPRLASQYDEAER